MFTHISKQQATLIVRLNNKTELNSANGKEILVYCELSSKWCFTQFLNIFCTNKVAILCYVKMKSSPVTGLEWPREFQELMVPRFHDNGTGWW